MSLFENFPYTNLHNLNLDWIIKYLKEVHDKADNIDEKVDEAEGYANDASGFADNASAFANDASDYADEAEGYKNTAQAILDTIREIQNTLLSNRLWGKQIAIYGDSYSASPRGPIWQVVLDALTGTTCHVSAQGALSLPEIYNTKWDNYNADIYIIEAGLNDVTKNTTGTTFMNTIINFVTSIRTINQNAEIYFVAPPDIPDTIMHNYVFPTEFYRQCYWHLMSKYNYGVIDGLKWQGLRYSDQVHASNDTAPLIGKYIFESIIKYGDAINFRDDYSKLGRDDLQLLFIISNGNCEVYTQNLAITSLDAGGAADISLSQMGLNVSPVRSMFCLHSGNVITPGYGFIRGNGTYTTLTVTINGKTTGDTATIPLGVRIPFFVNHWIKGF